MIQRRNLIIGAVASLIAAPTIVRASSLMTIKMAKPIRPIKLLKLYPYQKDIFHFMEHYGNGWAKLSEINIVRVSQETDKSLYQEKLDKFFQIMEEQNYVA